MFSSTGYYCFNNNCFAINNNGLQPGACPHCQQRLRFSIVPPRRCTHVFACYRKFVPFFAEQNWCMLCLMNTQGGGLNLANLSTLPSMLGPVSYPSAPSLVPISYAPDSYVQSTSLDSEQLSGTQSQAFSAAIPVSVSHISNSYVQSSLQVSDQSAATPQVFSQTTATPQHEPCAVLDCHAVRIVKWYSSNIPGVEGKICQKCYDRHKRIVTASLEHAQCVNLDCKTTRAQRWYNSNIPGVQGQICVNCYERRRKQMTRSRKQTTQNIVTSVAVSCAAPGCRIRKPNCFYHSNIPGVEGLICEVCHSRAEPAPKVAKRQDP